MKKILLSLLMAMSAFVASAQNIGEAFYIYRNDGGFNAFFRGEVDSIAYSNYDADSIWYDDVVSQVVYTADSTYFIPLAAIDSVGFVTPETIYSEGVKELTGDLFDYVIAVDGFNITLSSTTPQSLLPKQGDKIATVELTDKFPYGFSGYVTKVSTSAEGIILACDSIGLEEVVDKFYGIVEIEGGHDNEVQARRKTKSSAKQFNLDLNAISVPVSLSGFITKKKIFDIDGAANMKFSVKPYLTGKLSYVVDKTLLLSSIDLHTVTTLDCAVDIEIAGVASKEFKKNLLPRSDFLLPWGIPYYVEIGPKFELSGEFAVGTKVSTTVTCVQDITYRPILNLIPAIGMLFNRVSQDVQSGPINFDWKYVAGRGTLKGGAYLRVGIPLLKHDLAWVGGEFDGFFKANYEIFFDIDRLKQADKSTVLYDEIKDLCKLDIKPYVGAKFIASVADDALKFEIGEDFEKFGTLFSGRLLPAFSNVKAKRQDGRYGIGEISADISKSCPIPLTIGFSLFDKANNRVDAYYDWTYSTFSDFPSYKMAISNLYGGKDYRCYPIIKLFGYTMLASPDCYLDMSLEASTYDACAITKESAELGGLIYHYNPDLDKGECGFFYNTIGQPFENNSTRVSVGNLSSFPDGEFVKEITGLKPNTTYYFRVYYYADGEYIYGTPKTFNTKGDTLCPDSNHPHWIDLGLPSGTLWRCCNEGASTPEAYGGYYTFGQVSSAPTSDHILELI